MAFSTPRRVVLGLPSPSHRVCEDGRTYGCTDVRTYGHVTITSQPKFLGLIGYHISLAVELHWRALPAGSAKTTKLEIELKFMYMYKNNLRNLRKKVLGHDMRQLYFK